MAEAGEIRADLRGMEEGGRTYRRGREGEPAGKKGCGRSEQPAANLELDWACVCGVSAAGGRGKLVEESECSGGRDWVWVWTVVRGGGWAWWDA